MSGRPLYRSELIGAAPVGLVTVTYAGRVFRFSTQPVTIDTDDGDTYQYDGGLSALEMDAALGAMSSEPELQTIAVSAVFPVDVAELVEQGHDLHMADGEVAIHIPGTTWENRHIIVGGRLIEPVYGEDGEPVDFSLEQGPINDAGAFPAIQAVVSEDTWPNAPTDSLGLVYPWVFGAPGGYVSGSGSSLTTSGSPAIIVEVTGSNADTLLICDGHVDASTVLVFDEDSSESFSVTNTTDSLGRKVATVDVSGASTITLSDDEFWIGWNNGGGAQNDDRTDALTGAGEVMEAVLRRATVDIDRGRWQSARAALNGYKIAGYIDTTVTPWDWVRSNILPLLPVSIQSGPSGLYPVVWPLDALPEHAVENLQDGRNCTRVSRVTYLTGPREQYEEVQLQFAARQKTGAYRRVLLLRSTTTDQTAESHAAYLARRGALRGAAAVRAETSDLLYDSPTASKVASYWLKAATTAREVTYQAGVALGWLQPGMVVTVTDSAIYLAGQTAVVSRVSWVSMGAVEITVEIRANPARDSRRLAV